MSTQPITNEPPVFRTKSIPGSQPARKLHVNATTRFGIKLRALRRENSMTQTRMAAAFGIDRSFISDLELGKKSVSLPVLEIFALGFHMSLSDLLRDI